MTIEEKTADPALPEPRATKEKQQGADEPWENCKGQCGTTPWCRECMREKERLHEERLNRQGRSDDKVD